MPRFLSRVGAIGPAANAPQTIGTNTTGYTGGAYFGTDTKLFRAGADILMCNRLDQTLPPVDYRWNNQGLSGSIAVSASTNVLLIPAFAMPFDGDIVVQGQITLYTVSGGLAIAQVNLTSSTPTITNGPDSLVRLAGASGAGQEIFVVPYTGRWTGVAKATSVSIAAHIDHGGGSVALGLSASAATATLFRSNLAYPGP